MTWRLAVQEQMVDGTTLEEKFANASAAGFEGIELGGGGDGTFRARLPEIRRARSAGVVMPTVCVRMDHFIGDFDGDRRASARAGMAELLEVIVEAGGAGAITPAAFGLFSSALPPFRSPRAKADDRRILLEELGRLGQHAATVGSVLLVEPLNRYEDHMVNTLAQAVSLVEELGLPSVRVMADTFHMNIEEADPAASLAEAMPWVGHIQLGDSNRLEPGAGHTDWPALMRVLESAGYDKWMAMECSLSGPSAKVLPRVSALLRSA